MTKENKSKITVVNHYKTDLNKLRFGENNKVLNIMKSCDSPLGNPNYLNKKMSLGENLSLYLLWLYNEYKKKNGVYKELMKIVDWEKKGKNVYLVCCCKPKDCHGDIIKEFVESIIEMENNTIQ